MISEIELMQRAIAAARRGIAAGQSPFGCAIALNDNVIAECHNTVWLTTDITAHAEVTALREACTNAGEILLEGAIVATTCEPCPMCMAALHWARVKTVHYGATIADAEKAGFNELTISAREMVGQGGSSVQLVEGTLAEACCELFDDWKSGGGKSY